MKEPNNERKRERGDWEGGTSLFPEEHADISGIPRFFLLLAVPLAI